ncbi:LysR family transcriptional regulator [Nesterenkonia ebinurensis]|uniref:LysR family transcriptional regulator n=1 Tax=Nesterenkonia ebinurensis TaxID=2608252 RepID=UPI00123E3986|nr:LysR family transcriptional regulator [Nesterenkonia ebinurensis]
MEIRQLRYFAAVAEELHFGRAAERLHISQAPLSAQIQKLEREIGHQLFYRTTRSVSLTSQGHEFYERCSNIIGEIDEITSGLHLIAKGKAGDLHIGFVSSASYGLIPQAVRRFRELAPDVNLHLEPMTSGEQAEKLREGQLELGIVRGEHKVPGLSEERIFTEEIVACLPGDHRLTTQPEVSPAQLTKEPLIFFPPREMPGYASEIQAIFAGLPFPQVYTRIIQQENALGLVAAGLGFTLLSDSVAAFAPTNVHLSRISGTPRSTLNVVWLEGQESPAAQHFRSVLREVSPSLKP